MIKDSAPRASVAAAHAAPDPPPQVAPIDGADRPAIDDRRREVLCIQSELTHLLRTFGSVGAGTLRLEAFSRILNLPQSPGGCPRRPACRGLGPSIRVESLHRRIERQVGVPERRVTRPVEDHGPADWQLLNHPRADPGGHDTFGPVHNQHRAVDGW